jgi:hypothetical protein
MVCLFFCFFNLCAGTSGPAAITSLLYQLQMIGDGDCGETGGMKIGRGNRSTRRKPAPPQSPHDYTWVWTRAAAVWSQELTAWAVVGPSIMASLFLISKSVTANQPLITRRFLSCCWWVSEFFFSPLKLLISWASFCTVLLIYGDSVGKITALLGKHDKQLLVTSRRESAYCLSVDILGNINSYYHAVYW